MKLKNTTIVLLASLFALNVDAQQQLTKEQIMSMTTEQLSDLSMEELMSAVEILGVTNIDELFAMIMNKNVSSASKEEEDTFTSPLSSTVITRDEMRTYGISTIEEAFRLIPGMIVTEKANGIYDIQMRGLNNIPDNNLLLYAENANTLVMVDGRPVQNMAIGALNFDFLPISIEDVARIEVVRGACSALYGANAVSGVINIITDKPNNMSNKISGNVQIGNQNSRMADFAFRLSTLGGKLNFAVTANKQVRGRASQQVPVTPGLNRYIASDDILSSTEYVVSNQAQFAEWIADKKLIKDNSEFVDASVIKHYRDVAFGVDDKVILSNSESPESSFDIDKARDNGGVNGYVYFTPNNDMNFYLSFGYQNSNSLVTSVTDNINGLNYRTSKLAYVNFNSNIKDLSINIGYEFGPQNYLVGKPGFKVYANNFVGSAEYTIKLGGLKIKPNVYYSWTKYEDYLPKYTNENPKANNDYSWVYVGRQKPENRKDRLYGFLNGESHMYTIAPSVRFDYQLNNWRTIASVRVDKTRMPDKWTPSWQFATNYRINNDNFVRFVYGRANRGATFINSSTDFHSIRTNMTPETMVFTGVPNYELVSIDNFEVGYRVKPTRNILIDAEAYYSRSKGYNSLMSLESTMIMQPEHLMSAIETGLNGLGTAQFMLENGLVNQEAYMGMLMGAFQSSAEVIYNNMASRSYIQVQPLPYVVKQMGVGMNVDWIISSNLIAKLNANIQKTTIDKYYVYSQSMQISRQIRDTKLWSVKKVMSDVDENGNPVPFGLTSDALLTINEIANKLSADIPMEQRYMMAASELMGETPLDDYLALNDCFSKSPEEQNALCTAMKTYALTGVDDSNYNFSDKSSRYYVERPMCMYYALKYQMKYKPESDEYFFGSQSADKAPLENGHKHKATPSIFGTIGLIFKPVKEIEISSFVNFTGKREYATMYGTKTIDNNWNLNFKFGYKPVQGFEIFVNAHNLTNPKKQEFPYADKIGGLYTVGVNFGF